MRRSAFLLLALTGAIGVGCTTLLTLPSEGTPTPVQTTPSGTGTPTAAPDRTFTVSTTLSNCLGTLKGTVATSSATVAGGGETFSAGETVLLWQVQDVIGTAGPFPPASLANAGLYETLPLAAANSTSLNFHGKLQNSYFSNATTGQRAQVCQVFQFRNAFLDSSVSVSGLAWDGTSGGVVAIQAQTLTLSSGSVIDASGLGFRGAPVPTPTYPIDSGSPSCGTSPAPGNGEGFQTLSWGADTGTVVTGNGGGAGGPWIEGGGGGGNAGAGGAGGAGQTTEGGVAFTCSSSGLNLGGGGGYGTGTAFPGRLFPGGGGASGSVDARLTLNTGGSPAAGGNGGGLVFLIVDTGYSASPGGSLGSRGQSIPQGPNQSNLFFGAAGGGAGGTIFLQLAVAPALPWTLDVSGGDGQNAKYSDTQGVNPVSTDHGGGGGGGGGGLIVTGSDSVLMVESGGLAGFSHGTGNNGVQGVNGSPGSSRTPP